MGDFNETAALSVYLLIFGGLVAAGIISSGMRIGSMVKSLTTWGIIIVSLIAGYQYRAELQGFSDRILADLVPSRPTATTNADGRAAVSLDRSRNGHFLVDAVINGATIRALVDTGASTIVLTRQDAERIGIADDLAYTIPVMTANGIARAARGGRGVVEVGAIRREGIPLLVAEAGLLDTTLLGMDFISTLSGFEIRSGRLILTD